MGRDRVSSRHDRAGNLRTVARLGLTAALCLTRLVPSRYFGEANAEEDAVPACAMQDMLRRAAMFVPRMRQAAAFVRNERGQAVNQKRHCRFRLGVRQFL